VSLIEARSENAPEAPLTLARHRATVEALALTGLLLLFFCVLGYVNCVWACYPIDNDLDEVGWLTAHLSLSRAESFANRGYPPGLPIMAGPCALLCAALAGLPVFISEFRDGSSTALFLCGLWLLTRRSADQRGFFLFGLSAGLSYLFRSHYLILMALVPAALILAGFGWRNAGRAALAFVAGFAATAWPLWLLNLLVYGTPLHAGVSQYNIAYALRATTSFNWENYPGSYNHWPVSRILRERPFDLLANSKQQLVATLTAPLSLAGAGLGGFAMVHAHDRLRRQLLAFAGLLALLYVGVANVPTRYTDRAHGIRFAILEQRPQTQAVFRSPPPEWKLLFSDERLSVWAIPPAPEPQKEAAAPAP
jgi:hypothetical protein